MKGVWTMKKRDLWTGVGFAAVGICFLLGALLFDTALDSLFCGFAGAFAVPGIVQIVKYIKWTRPENAPIYHERLEQEQIDLRDERKMMLRDRAGRYAYALGMLLLAGAIVMFSILEILGVVSETTGHLMVFFLAAYLLFQYIAGAVIYRLLARRY